MLTQGVVCFQITHDPAPTMQVHNPRCGRFRRESLRHVDADSKRTDVVIRVCYRFKCWHSRHHSGCQIIFAKLIWREIVKRAAAFGMKALKGGFSVSSYVLLCQGGRRGWILLNIARM